MYEDDLEEGTLQAYADPAEEEMIKHRGLIQGTDTDTPLHDESVIAVRDNFLDASDEKVSDEDGCLYDDQSAEQDRDRGDLLDHPYVTLHVRLMGETKDSINKVCL